MASLRAVAVIPARFASTRFPGKPLAPIAGRPMIEHVWLRCQEAQAFERVIVATDDERIAEVVRGFGGEAVMTSASCATGTDRVAEIAKAQPDTDVWINVQGDEPLAPPETLRVLTELFTDPTVEMGTLVRPLEPAEAASPNIVKAVLALSGEALYFSRASLPFVREASAQSVPRFAHLGLYGYRRATLLKLATLRVTPLEEAEKLEQLRALEHGIRIRCAQVTFQSVAVDVPEDVARVEALMRTTRRPIVGPT